MSTSLKYLAYLIGSSKTISYLARHGWLKPALQSWIDKHVGGRGFEELAQSESLTPDLQADLATIGATIGSDKNLSRLAQRADLRLAMQDQIVGLAHPHGLALYYLANRSDLDSGLQNAIITKYMDLHLYLDQGSAFKGKFSVIFSALARAQHFKITPKMQDEIIERGNGQDLLALVHWAGLKPKLQSAIIEKGNEKTLAALTRRDDLRPELQEKIASVGDVWTLYRLSMRKDLKPELQSILATRGYNASLEILAESVGKLAPEVQDIIAARGSKYTLKLLSKRSDFKTGLQSIIDEFAYDEDWDWYSDVDDFKKLKPKQKRAFIKKGGDEFLAFVAKYGIGSELEIQEMIAARGNDEALSELVDYSKLKPDLQGLLASRGDYNTLEGLAMREDLKPEIQAKIAERGDTETLQLLAGREDLLDAVRDKIAGRYREEERPQVIKISGAKRKIPLWSKSMSRKFSTTLRFEMGTGFHFFDD